MARIPLVERSRTTLFAVVVLASACWFASDREANGASVSEGPLSPVADVAASFWNRTPSGASMYSLLADSSCQATDSTYLSTSTGGASFLVRVAPGAAHNGKKIRSFDVALCFRYGASAGAGFTPRVAINGSIFEGTPLTASAGECQETVQAIPVPIAVTKSDSTTVDVGIVKSEADTRTVRICSIRVTIHYEDDPPPPPPPLPAITKTAADLDATTPGTQSVDAARAYWDVAIDNTAAGTIARQAVLITDGHSDAVLESATPAGACGAEPSQGPAWTCGVAAGGATVLRVSRPRSAIANACTGGLLANFLSSATLGDGTPLSIQVGTAASPAAISIPPDTTACPLPGARLVAHDPPVANGFAYWDVMIEQPPGGITRTVSIQPASAVDISSQAPAGSCTVGQDGLLCDVPAEGGVTVTVRRTLSAEHLASGTLCTGGTIALHLAWASLAGGAPLAITSGGADGPVSYPVQDTGACDPVAVAKSLRPAGAATVEDPDGVAWLLSISNPATGLHGAGVVLRDTTADIVSGPVYSTGGDYCSGDLTSTAGVSCVLPAGVSVQWTVRPAGGTQQECSARTFGNVAQYRAAAEAGWVDLPGPDIVLSGNTERCTRLVEVCLVVEDNLDASEEPDGGQFRFGNSGNATTLVLEATEGGTSCGEMLVPAAPVSLFQSSAEAGDRPGSNGLAGRWSGDAPGFPRAFAGEATCDSAPTAELALVEATESRVTFCNRPVPRTRSVVVVHHYFPAGLPSVRPALTFSAPAILPSCTAADASDGSYSTWACLVPADWSGQVDVRAPEGRVSGACPTGLEPAADYRSCSYGYGALSVRAAFIEHGVPLADVEFPVVAIDGQSIPPAPGPAGIDWGPLPVDPLAAHAAGIRFDAGRWRLSGTPTLGGEECGWGTPPAAGSADVLVTIPAGGGCAVTFTLERLVASVTVHQLYLGAVGDPPTLSTLVDGVADAGTWLESGSPVGTWRKSVGIASAGSAVTVTAAIPAGWAPVAVFPGDCSLFGGAPDPSPAVSASITAPTVQPGDDVQVCFVSVAVGSLVLVVNETHPTDGPEDWTFAATTSYLGNPVLTTPPNGAPGPIQVSALRAFARIPVGSYEIRQFGGRGACTAGAATTDYQTTGAAKLDALPTDAEAAVVIGGSALTFAIGKGRTTYVRFDNAGCGTILETGVINVELVNDLDGDGTRDPGEAGIAGWPVEVTGPDGSSSLLTDSLGKVQFPVINGGAYLVSLDGQPGWRATSPAQVVVSAGLAQTVDVSFSWQPRVAIAASMTEISLSRPAGTPGEGWVFSLEGCGEARSASTAASGTVTFQDLPPAAGCEYKVSAGTRPGWSTVAASRLAVPAGPGEVATLSFASVRIEVCLDCAPSPGAGSTGESNPASAVLRVAAGSNLVTWPGGPVPVEEVFTVGGGVRAVYLWDSESGTWLKFFPGLPGYLSDLRLLTPGAAYWVIASGALAIPVPGTG